MSLLDLVLSRERIQVLLMLITPKGKIHLALYLRHQIILSNSQLEIFIQSGLKIATTPQGMIFQVNISRLLF